MDAHELLHSLVDELVLSEDFSSAMMTKYKAEHPNVLVHLHLMAIQRAAYLKLGEKDLLEGTNSLYAFIGGDYQQAWKIIETEGADAFLAELRAYEMKARY